MHCKICGKSGCTLISTTKSLVVYPLEEDIHGNFHYHDKNYVNEIWKCEENHEFICIGISRCWCGWNSRSPDKIYHEKKPIDPEKIPKFFKFGNEKKIVNTDWIYNIKNTEI